MSLVHNPVSGDDDHAGEHLVELIRRAGYQVRYFQSKRDWQPALDGESELVAIAGGDGTVAEVARAAAGRPVALTVLPTGTANNVAGWLGFTGIPIEELVEGWGRASLQPFDLGIARSPRGTHPFLESIGIGVLTTMMSEIDAGTSAYVNKLDGRAARIAAAVEVLGRVLQNAEPVQCELRLDDRTVSGDFLLVEALNFGVAGPNLRLAPLANGADGLLDVVLVEDHERALLEDHLAAVSVDPVNAPPLPVHHARQVTIQCAGGLLHCDDEVWSADHTGPIVVEITIEAGALTFLVPPARDRPASA